MATESPPITYSYASSTIGQVGGSAGFSVAVTGHGPFTFQWYHNGTPVVGATQDSLFFSNLTVDHAGNYTVVISNAFGVITNGPYTLDFDTDHDGLPDLWEIKHFGSITAQNGSDDFDRDGVSNLTEYLDGTDPTNPASAFFRLRLTQVQCEVVPFPDLPKYTNGQLVTLTALPFPDMVFSGWGGALSGTTNPVTLIMDHNKAISAVAGLALGEALDLPNRLWLSGGMGWYGQTRETFDQVDAAQTVPIGPSQQSWFQTGITNTGLVELDYWWREANLHFLSLYVNGILSDATSTVEWENRRLFLAPGTNLLQWVYSWNAAMGQNQTALSDAAWVDQVSLSNLITVPLVEALDSPKAGWQTGRIPWFGQTNVAFDHVSAAQSGPVAHGQQTWLQRTNVWNTEGILSFWWKVNSVPNEDYVRFYLNGMEQVALSGNHDWQQAKFFLGAGTNILRWEFTKQSYVGSMVNDGVWLDQVVLTPYADPGLDLDHNYLPDLSEFLFRGGTGDGFAQAAVVNILLGGPAADATPCFGGTGDGFAAESLFNVALNGSTDSVVPYLGSVGDGFSSATLFNRSLNETSNDNRIFIGSFGDGFSSSTRYNTTLAPVVSGDQDAVFLGGEGDGFCSDATDAVNVLLSGPVPELGIYRGDSGDGFSKATLYNVSLRNDAAASLADIFTGGVGDGYSQSQLYNVDFEFIGKDIGIYLDDAVVLLQGLGATNMAFIVRLSSASSRSIIAGFATSNLTATAGVDYRSTNGTVAFAPGETNKTIHVIALGHAGTITEQAFVLNLSNPINVSFGRPQALGILINGNVDTDSDGVPDWWMLSHFGHATGSAGDYSRSQDDPDGDGMSNLAEYLADTDPLDYSSLLSMTSISLLGPGNIAIGWQGGIQATQYLQVTVPPAGSGIWRNLFTNLPPTSVLNSHAHFIGTNSTLWYRIVVPGRR